MLVTANPTATTLTVTRAQLGTTAVEHVLVDVSTEGIENARIFTLCPIIKLPSKCKGKNIEDCPTSKRYEAVGRSMSINVMEWLGSRIQKVHEKYQD